jgi:hypothetical protein
MSGLRGGVLLGRLGLGEQEVLSAGGIAATKPSHAQRADSSMPQQWDRDRNRAFRRQA